MTSVKIILNLIINLSVRLLKECTVLEAAFLVTANVVCIISCKNFGDQYVSSVDDFNPRFRIHKEDIKTKKDRSGTVRHFKNKFCDSSSPYIFLQEQSIEYVQSDITLESKLWQKEEYWQCQLFANTHAMNSERKTWSKRKTWRKNWWC